MRSLLVDRTIYWTWKMSYDSKLYLYISSTKKKLYLYVRKFIYAYRRVNFIYIMVILIKTFCFTCYVVMVVVRLHLIYYNIIFILFICMDCFSWHFLFVLKKGTFIYRNKLEKNIYYVGNILYIYT